MTMSLTPTLPPSVSLSSSNSRAANAVRVSFNKLARSSRHAIRSESYFAALKFYFTVQAFSSSEIFIAYIISATPPRLLLPRGHRRTEDTRAEARVFHCYYCNIFNGLISCLLRIETKEPSKRMKRPLELSRSSGLAPDIEQDEAKAAKRPSGGSAAEVEEFLALLERIENAEKCLKAERELYLSNYFTKQEKCATAAEAAADKTSKCASPSWRPSFEWEDFSYANRLPEKGHQRVPTSESATAERCSETASKDISRGNAGVSGKHEGLDLNVESSPELTLSGGLQLFF